MSEPRPVADWRLRGQKYRLVGEKCDSCGEVIFPPRDICPRCSQDVAPPVSPGYVDELKRRMQNT